LRKGTPYLLESFRIVQKKIPDARLLLTRTIQDDIKPILSRYADLPIDWSPPLPHAQLVERLQSADIFVLPSLEEGLVRTACEAMACGLPAILTRTPERTILCGQASAASRAHPRSQGNWPMPFSSGRNYHAAGYQRSSQLISIATSRLKAVVFRNTENRHRHCLGIADGHDFAADAWPHKIVRSGVRVKIAGNPQPSLRTRSAPNLLRSDGKTKMSADCNRSTSCAWAAVVTNQWANLHSATEWA